MKAGTVAVGSVDPGVWSQCFGQSLIDLLLVDGFGTQRIVPHGRQLRVLCTAGALVERRNEIVEQFLDATECEWLFMVDSDMGFGPNTVEALIASADPQLRPVVGGLCFGLRRESAGEFYGVKRITVPTLYEFVDAGDTAGFRSIIPYPRDTLVRIDGTGAACLMIHRSALDQVRLRYGNHWFDQLTHSCGVFSEDLSFCVRLAACDIPLYVDTSVRTTHDKGGVFLDEDEFDRCQALHHQPA